MGGGASASANAASEAGGAFDLEATAQRHGLPADVVRLLRKRFGLIAGSLSGRITAERLDALPTPADALTPLMRSWFAVMGGAAGGFSFDEFLSAYAVLAPAAPVAKKLEYLYEVIVFSAGSADSAAGGAAGSALTKPALGAFLGRACFGLKKAQAAGLADFVFLEVEGAEEGLSKAQFVDFVGEIVPDVGRVLSVSLPAL